MQTVIEKILPLEIYNIICYNCSMRSYDELYRLLDKGTISLSELRSLPDEDLVSKVELQNSDKWDCNKYSVTIEGNELYFVYVKKSISELLNILKKSQKKTV